MSLLVDITANALDLAYLDAAQRKASAGATPADGEIATAAPSPWLRGRRGLAMVAVVLAAAGALFATAAVATHRQAAATRHDRKQLIQQVQQQTNQTDQLQAQLDSLRTQVSAASRDALSASDRGAALQEELRALDAVDGTQAADGPGVEVVLDNAKSTGNASADALGVIFDRDIQAVVNALFVSGAEAIAVNGQRLTSQTAIREAGSAILVDYRPLSPPYRIDAIGPHDLGSKFLASQTAQLYKTWEQVYGLRFSMTEHARLTLPSAASPVVHYAKPLDAQ